VSPCSKTISPLIDGDPGLVVFDVEFLVEADSHGDSSPS
jgi:hypothetical protein